MFLHFWAMLDAMERICFQKISSLSKTTPRSLNESTDFNVWPSIIRSGCGGLTVLEWMITIEVNLLRFKHISRILHHDSILVKSRFKDFAVIKRSVGDFIVTYKVQSSAYVTIFLSRPDHTSAVKIIKRSGPKTLS